MEKVITISTEDYNIILIKLLGLYSQNYGKVLDIDKFNTMLNDFGIDKKVDFITLNSLLSLIKTNDVYKQYYNSFLDKQENVIDLLCDINNVHYNIDNDTFYDIINYVTTLSELRNGNLYSSKLSKVFNNVDFDDELMSDILKVSGVYTNVIKYLPYQKNVINNKDSFDIVSKLNTKKREIQNLTRKYNKLKRDVSDYKILSDSILKALSHIKYEKPKPVSVKPDSDSDLVVCLSDIHVGLKTKDFNLEVLKERLDNYLSYIKYVTNQSKIDTINIINLGDVIENVYMHLNQMNNVEFDLSEQVAKALMIVVNFAISVRSLGYKTTYTGIMGNHDRLNPNKKQNIVGDSASKIINIYMKEIAEDLDITYIEPKQEIRGLLNIAGYNICYTHGDYDKILNNNIISKLNNYFDSNIDIVLGGHYHNLNIQNNGVNKYVIQSGAMFTGNDYSDSLGLTSNAVQVMLKLQKGKKGVNIIPVIFN